MSNTDSQRLESMRRQRDGYRNQLRKTEQQIQRVREALGNHPRTCDQHTEDDPVKCGWKRAVIDVQNALGGDGRG